MRDVVADAWFLSDVLADIAEPIIVGNIANVEAKRSGVWTRYEDHLGIDVWQKEIARLDDEKWNLAHFIYQKNDAIDIFS